MWSEEMDNRIRGAAENDSPAYDEKTWGGMELLLDKHLPQKRKRRGIILFAFLGLLIAVPGVYMIAKLSSGEHIIAEQQQSATTPSNDAVIKQNNNVTAAQSGENKTIETPVADKSSVNNNVTTATAALNNISQHSTTPAGSNSGNNNPAMDIQVTNAGIGSKKDHPVTIKNTASSANQPVTGNAKTAGASIIAPVSPSVISNAKTTTPANTAIQSFTNENITGTGKNQPDNKTITTTPAQDNKNVAVTTPAPAVQTPAKSNIDSAATAKTDAPAEKSDIQKHKKQGNKFSINFSLGPDLTSVGLDRVGKVKNQYGVGIGYAFSDRISVRTGFYAGRKIYSADSTNYHNVYTSGTYSYKLFNIDANCLVYEVPVTVSYSFPSSKKHNWLVSTGLSSYFMKKEDYVYTYKAPNPSVPLWSTDSNYRNENQHYFSVLNLSGGYQYNVSKRFSLLAEPYLKVPLTGIGAGKVRLNSAGILFTASIRPFAK